MRMTRAVLSVLSILVLGAGLLAASAGRAGPADEGQGHGRAGQPPREARHRRLHRPTDAGGRRPRGRPQGRRVVLRPLRPGGRRRPRRLDPRELGRGRRSGAGRPGDRAGHERRQRPRSAPPGGSGSGRSGCPICARAISPGVRRSPEASARSRRGDVNDATRGLRRLDRRRERRRGAPVRPASCTWPMSSASS
ncbi:MAG: hypothetical protein M0C28_05415 [Candidatus Moduliflexus flocculans]|nr:hypothetical protein [Candidatus Moduliflexus flocculans]